MNILVTGGAGFIGSHIVDAYIARKHHVAVIDNLATGFRKNLHPRARFYKADIRNQKLVERIIQKERPRVINHHAAIAEVVKSMRDPKNTLDVNVLGTATLLAAFAQYKSLNKRFIFASTGGAIYGDPARIPATEHTPALPLSPYGTSKLLGEELVRFYARMYNFKYLLLRYANVYGPRQNPKGEAGVVAIFADLMRTKQQPTIFGDGTKARDYVHINDVVRANMLGLTRGTNTVTNIGTGKLTSDSQVFKSIAQIVEFKHPPRYAPLRDGEVHKISIDAGAAYRTLGWKPRIDFERGVRRVVESYL